MPVLQYMGAPLTGGNWYRSPQARTGNPSNGNSAEHPYISFNVYTPDTTTH